MTQDAREAFVERVKTIDPIFRRGNLEAFWPPLRELIRMAPDRADVSKKKSHYLTSLAARSLVRGDPVSAKEFLDLADRSVDPTHMTPFLVRERAEFREMTEEALAAAPADRHPQTR